MKTKTYFANSVPAALEVARQELGPDALLLNSRPAPEEFRNMGRLEVMFAWDTSPASETRAVRPVMQGAEPVSEIADIREQLVALRASLNHRRDAKPQEAVTGPDSSSAEWRLSEAGFSPAFARELSIVLDAEGPEALQRVLTAKVARAPEAGPDAPRTIALIGAPGRGKTTSLVKLAIRLGIARRKPVRLYSVGAHVIGAREQLTRYAAILGVPLQTFETPAALHLALNGESWNGVILIDTPGLSQSEEAEMLEIQNVFRNHLEIEKHLVVRASEQARDILRCIGRFAPLAPSHLLFTGLDESLGLAAIVETLAKSGLPCSWTTTGPRIPGDIQESDAGILIRRFTEGFGNLRHNAAQAAGAGR